MSNSVQESDKVNSGKFIKVKAIITDSGDPSVGIFQQSWEVECPFYKDEDDEIKEFFRKAITEAYKEFTDGRLTVEFDYEREYKDDF